jgi:serine/threonine protein kinase/Flp pilus assembly protein TadD
MTASGEPSAAPLRRLTPSHYVEFSRLGEGSMGLVYLALDTELNRRVAFKMIRPPEEESAAEPLEATPTPEDETFGELRARFLQEAWVTGGLEHPGIVPVYELGETTGGIPYYTMRVVRGERTLTDAIEQAEGLDGRLALLEPFLKVCDTVRYAHARGVIHRDLKPANIALGDYGEAVVLDWGLAKLRDRPDLARSVWQQRIEELRDETDLQTLASAIGTPGYMSPEAALVEVDKVDARSDVYSLGAILYRILTGRLPYEFRSYPELVRKLTTEAPRDPGEIDAAVPAGLSRICLKALSAKREERYADADEVAAAIRGWQRESALEREVTSLLREAESALETAPDLGGEALLRQVDRVTAVCARILELRPGHEQAQALQARGHALRERAIVERERGARKRLLRRVAVIGLAVATAATVVVALLLDAKRREAEEARTREAQARTRAEQERMRAEDLAGFMLFDLRDGLEPIGRLDLLNKVARKSKDYYASLPAEGASDQTVRGRATASHNVGQVLEAQGDLAAALESYRTSLAAFRRLATRRANDGRLQHNLSVLLGRISGVLVLQGDLDGALAAQRESLAIDRSLAEREPTNATWQHSVSVALDGIGDLHDARGDLKAALETYRESLEIRKRLVAREPENADWQRSLGIAHERIGTVLEFQGDLEGALENYRASLALGERLTRQDPSHAIWQSDLGTTLNNIGDVLQEQGDLEGALQHYRRSLDVARRLAERDPTNADHRSDVAACLARVGGVLELQEDHAGALRDYRESLAIRKRLADQDPSNADWQDDLALSLVRVGAVRQATGQLAEALEHQRDALAIRRRLVALDPSNTDWLRNLALSLERVGMGVDEQEDVEGALGHYREALKVRRQLAAQDPSNGLWQRDLEAGFVRVGSSLDGLGDIDGALEHLHAALDIAKRLAAQDPSNAIWQYDHAAVLLILSAAYQDGGRLAEALRYGREAVTTHRRAVDLAPHFAGGHEQFVEHTNRLELLTGERQPKGPGDHLALGRFLYGRKDYPRAAQHFTRALADPARRTELLYDAACSAALASAALEGQEAARWRGRALEWLGEDLRRRRAILAQVEKELAMDVQPERRARLEKQRQSLLAHFEHACVKDADLASLRGTPEFEALFEK